MGKFDSIVHKYGNPYYHNVNRCDKNLLILTDKPNTKLRSEINTIDNMLPIEAGYNGGYYQLCRILNNFEENLPSWNMIKL